MSGSKVMLIINFRLKSKMAAKRTPWDNISQWEHQNSFIRQSEECKKVSYKNISLGCMGTPSSSSTNRYVVNLYDYFVLFMFGSVEHHEMSLWYIQC